MPIDKFVFMARTLCETYLVQSSSHQPKQLIGMTIYIRLNSQPKQNVSLYNITIKKIQVGSCNHY
jgi:hypothetical protein